MDNYSGTLWWSEGVFFSCLGCGRCCRGKPGAIFVTPEEISLIMKFLGITSEELFQRKYMTKRWNHPSIAERSNGDCVLFDKTMNKCMVYPVRPAQCALFPFWPSVFASSENWEYYSRQCPGMGQGNFFDAETIAELLADSPFADL